MSRDPLDGELALARELMRARPTHVEPQRKARLWVAIDENIRKEERPFRLGWFLGWGTAFAAAAAAIMLAISAEQEPAVHKAPAPAITLEEIPRPVEDVPAPQTRWIVAEEKKLELEGATLSLAPGSELEQVEASNYHLVAGTVEVSIDATTPVSFTSAGGKVSVLSARFRMTRTAEGASLEVLSGSVVDATGFLPPPRKISVEQRMEEADQQRLAGRIDRAIAAYEKVTRDRDATAFHEEAMLRQAELYRSSDRPNDALRVLAAAEARIGSGLLSPERIALEAELLIAADRLDDAARALEKAAHIESPALTRARASFVQKKDGR